ncbi:putative transposase [Gordonia polyisoprenivorans NBRC 16320 = JCM 10675]|nr:putative transposase [Gordonia polyisoprenivorans NBRC 16320 = JCM 10675]
MGSGEIAEPTNRMSWGSTAILLVGPLSHSGQWRGYLAPDMTRPQVIDGIDRITPPTRWGYQVVAIRPDGHRLPPSTGKLTAEFAGVSKHYRVSADVCPPRGRNNCKDVR